jgi:chemotaxis protein methyltransferase CheR
MSANAERFSRLIEKRLGLQFEESRLGALAEVLERRSRGRGITSRVYLGLLEADALESEYESLAPDLTVAETYFFRNINQFHALTEWVLPEVMAARSRERTIRVLSAGCASGEEPYSISMVLREACGANWSVAVKAVDLNAASLQKANRGRFSRWAFRETPPELQQRWFVRDGDEYVLDTTVRQSVEFERGNLADNMARVWRPASYDIVFCRNVMMYFAPDRARLLVDCIAQSLAPGGFLFLGHAETLRGLSNDFELCHTHDTFYYRLTGNSLGSPTPDVRSPAAASAEWSAASWVAAVGSANERIRQLVPAASTDFTLRPDPAQTEYQPQCDLTPALDLLRQERFGDALGVLGNLPPESDRDEKVLLLRSALLTHCGRLAEAEKSCRQLLRLDERSAGAHYLLALCHESRNDSSAAMQQNQIAIHLDPCFSMAHLHFGLLAKRAGRRDAARLQLRQAFSLLHQEDDFRLLLFGGGFSREALMTLCQDELAACGGLR